MHFLCRPETPRLPSQRSAQEYSPGPVPWETGKCPSPEKGRMNACRGDYECGREVNRSFTLITNFSPDHTSFTAQTFTSTRPASSPILRTSFSFRSVAMPDVFLGQLTHSIPAGASRRAYRGNCSF